jgi:hypothetical protein
VILLIVVCLWATGRQEPVASHDRYKMSPAPLGARFGKRGTTSIYSPISSGKYDTVVIGSYRRTLGEPDPVAGLQHRGAVRMKRPGASALIRPAGAGWSYRVPFSSARPRNVCWTGGRPGRRWG